MFGPIAHRPDRVGEPARQDFASSISVSSLRQSQRRSPRRGEDEGKTITATIAPSVKFWGDGDLLSEMLANLLDNAIRHTPQGLHIEVSFVNQGSQLVASVADDGPGVPPAERERIFRRFYRVEGSTSTAGSNRTLVCPRGGGGRTTRHEILRHRQYAGPAYDTDFRTGCTQHKATAPDGFASHRSRPGARGTRNCAASTGTGRNGSAAKLGSKPARIIEKHASQAPRVSGSIRIDNPRVAEPTQTTS